MKIVHYQTEARKIFLGCRKVDSSSRVWTNRSLADILAGMTKLSAPRRKTPITRFILPLVSIGLLVILWRWDLKWGTVPVIVFVIFYYGVLPKISRSMTARFNRKALLLLTGGKAAEVPRLVRRSFFFQLIAPKGVLDAKSAFAYLACEQFPAALRSFENAVPYADTTERTALVAGMTKALWATGDFAAAEAEGRELIRYVTRLPETLLVTARSRLGLGKNDDETRRLLDEAESLSPSDDVRLMVQLTRIECALDAGRKPPELPEAADSTSKLIRSWIHFVRGLLRENRGDTEKALQSFEKARTVLQGTFVFRAASSHIEALRDADKGDGTQTCAMDEALRRKKKKRR